MNDVRVSLGVSGHSHVDPRLAGLPSTGGRHAFPAGWALVEHPQHGRILFDCGYGAPARDAMQRGLRRAYRLLLGACCPRRGDAVRLLQARGIDAADIDWIVISHFHPDHVGALREFPRARFIAHAHAWASVQRGPLARLHAQIWRELLPDDITARLRLLAPAAFAPLDDDLAPLGRGIDLFGDGSLVAIELPGHADGQIGLATRHGDERVVLVADAFWQRGQVRGAMRLSWLARRLAMHRPDAYDTTIARLRAFAHASPEAWLIASHCAETLAGWAAQHPDAVLTAAD